MGRLIVSSFTLVDAARLRDAAPTPGDVPR